MNLGNSPAMLQRAQELGLRTGQTRLGYNLFLHTCELCLGWAECGQCTPHIGMSETRMGAGQSGLGSVPTSSHESWC